MNNLRAEAFASSRHRGPRIATDVFLWACGEAPNPAMTKIGGVPYRPRSLNWSRDGEGKRIRYIAQLCFADSRDIVGDLPGDVLLIFGDDGALLVEANRLVFEWSKLGIQELALEVPQMRASELLTPYYGVIHLTEDWPDATEEIGGRYGYPWLLRVFEGTKIGDMPRFIQDEPTPAAAGTPGCSDDAASFVSMSGTPLTISLVQQRVSGIWGSPAAAAEVDPKPPSASVSPTRSSTSCRRTGTPPTC